MMPAAASLLCLWPRQRRPTAGQSTGPRPLTEALTALTFPLTFSRARTAPTAVPDGLRRRCKRGRAGPAYRSANKNAYVPQGALTASSRHSLLEAFEDVSGNVSIAPPDRLRKHLRKRLRTAIRRGASSTSPCVPATSKTSKAFGADRGRARLGACACRPAGTTASTMVRMLPGVNCGLHVNRGLHRRRPAATSTALYNVNCDLHPAAHAMQ